MNTIVCPSHQVPFHGNEGPDKNILKVGGGVQGLVTFSLPVNDPVLHHGKVDKMLFYQDEKDIISIQFFNQWYSMFYNFFVSLNPIQIIDII